MFEKFDTYDLLFITLEHYLNIVDFHLTNLFF